MSIPEWQHKLENVEFRYSKRTEVIIEWLLKSPDAKEIPENIRKARLAKHGYSEPAPTPEKRSPGRPKKNKEQQND